jgi:xylulokinase
MDYVIGCDVGTQSTKAMLVSFDGATAGEASEGYDIDYPHPLWAEQPVERFTGALTGAVRRLLAETGVSAEAVRAIGLATQVDGVVPVDSAGNPLRPAIIWMDRRSTAQCEPVRQRLGDQQVFNLTGLNLNAYHVAPKIRWIAENEPENYERAARFLLPGSAMALWLTGEAGVDYSNASSTMLLDVRTKEWSQVMCQAFGIEPERLAPVLPADAPLGRLRSPAVADALGLRRDTLVVVGCGDEHSASLGAGIVRPGLVCDVAGTAEPVCAASQTVVFDPTGLVETHCHAARDLWLIENPGFVSGGNVRWYREQFGGEEARAAAERGISPYRLLDEAAAQVPPGSNGMVFLPCLMGATAPTWNDSARGVYFGFTLAHDRAHFTRALLEGTAYALRDIINQMQAIGLGLGEVRVVGGGAKSALWNRIKADVVGLPLAVPETLETTALGAAMLALVGAGASATLSEAVDLAVRIKERVEPQAAGHAAYEQHYQLYRSVYQSLLPAFDQVAATPLV